MNYTRKNLPDSARFMKISGGEDGTFYVAVNHPAQVKKIKAIYNDSGYTVSAVRRDTVPPCRFSYYEIPGHFGYWEHTWNGGEDFYFPEEDET